MKLKDLKQEIMKNTIEGYKVKINFSSCDFLIEIGSMIIIAKPICLEKEVKYEFMLDTQFLSNNEITYEEIVMIKNTISSVFFRIYNIKSLLLKSKDFGVIVAV